MGIKPSDAVEGEEFGTETADVASDHAAAEGTPTETSLGSRKSLQDMLLSTGPETRLEDVDSPWDPVRGGPTRIMRGLQKMTDFDGMPAIGDIIIGVAETVVAFEPEGGDSSNGDVEETATADDVEIEDPAAGAPA